MTVTSQISSQTFAGNGAQTVFSFAFNIPAAGDAQVYLVNSSGVITGPLASTAYSITGYNNDAGGTLTYPLIGSPLPSGWTITLERALSEVQETSLGDQGPYFPSAVEQALDYLTMLLQQVSSVQDRALSVPNVDPVPLQLPPVAQRANQMLGFDGSGNPIAASPSSALVSSAMQPVVSAATVALARTALGLGSIATGAVGYGLQDDGAGNIRVNATTYDDAVSVNPVPASYHMTRRDATGPISYTLARANTYWNGFSFAISAITGGPITVAIDAHDAFVGFAPGISIIIYPGQFATITTDGASSGTWYADVSGQGNVPVPVSLVTGANYTILQTDWGSLVQRSHSAAITDTIPQATGAFGVGFWLYYQNVGSTMAWIYPAAGTIAGLSSIQIPPGGGVLLVSDGANWKNAGAPLPSNGRYLLNTLQASAGVTTALQDTTSFGAGFNYYEIYVDNFLGSTPTDGCLMQYYSSGTYQTTGYIGYSYWDISGGVNAAVATAGLLIANFNIAAYTYIAPGARTIVRVSNPTTVAKNPAFWNGAAPVTGGPVIANEHGSGFWNNAATVTGFRIICANSLTVPAAGHTFGLATTVKVYGFL